LPTWSPGGLTISPEPDTLKDKWIILSGINAYNGLELLRGIKEWISSSFMKGEINVFAKKAVQKYGEKLCIVF
jgi:hypothetical protein